MLYNKKVNVKTSLVANGISIPHYYYHNDPAIAGNCRVCLVKLKNSIKPVVSCDTNANAGLYINTVLHRCYIIKKGNTLTVFLKLGPNKNIDQNSFTQGS